MKTNKQNLDKNFNHLFSLTFKLLSALEIEYFPDDLKEKLGKIQNEIELLNQKPIERLRLLNKNPTINKMIEPKVAIKQKYDPRHRNHTITEKQLEVRKYRKELKSAIKEIKQDNQFLSRIRLDEQMEKYFRFILLNLSY